MGRERLLRGFGNGADRFVHRDSELLQEMFRQHRDVIRSLPQCRRAELHHVQPVIKVFTEIVLANSVDNVAIRRGDEPDIDTQFLVAADPREGAILQKTQQLGLQRAAHVADFVEENGPAIGLFNASRLLFQRAGKRALFVAEQFAFEQRFGNRRAVDTNVVARVPLAQGVERARNQFFACAAFAQDQHGGIGRRYSLDQLAQFANFD